MDEYKKILVIKLGSLGDWIQMTGSFAAIRHRWPTAHITLMTGKAYFKLAKQSPFFDDYIEDNRTWNPFDYWRIVKTMAAGNFDLIIDLQMQKRTQQRYYSFLRLLTGKPFCWAHPCKGKLLRKHILAKPRLWWGKEEEDSCEFISEMPSLSFCHAAPEVLSLLPKSYVLMIPGCSPSHPYKRWPADNYKTLVGQLAAQNIYSVVLGTNAEKKEIDLICQDNPMAVNFCNKSSVLDIPEMAQKALAVVGNDTGPQHMAELSDTPAITLFCARTQHSAIHRSNVTNLVGAELSDIKVEQVLQTLQSLWHKA